MSEQDDGPQSNGVIPLSEPNVAHALTYVATFLNDRRHRLSIIQLTGEFAYVDNEKVAKELAFFGTHLLESEKKLMAEAMDVGQKKSGMPLTQMWMNEAVQMNMGCDDQAFLTKIAFDNKFVVFKYSNLEVYTVPGKYKFIIFANRMQTSDRKQTDLKWAVLHLRRGLKARGQTLPAQEISSWSNRFGKPYVGKQVLQEINGEFRRRFGWYAIQFQPLTKK